VFIFVMAKPSILLIALGVLASGCLAYAVWQFFQYMSRHYHEIISGKKTALAADLARVGLGMLAPFYGLGVRLRNAMYDRHWARILRVPIPVVSLGNLTAGGTGKTPLAAFVARWFGDRGVRVCFISRGYRAGADGLNDEARVLKAQCPDVPHLQTPDRVAAAFVAAEESESQLVILDDGFQHRRLARDLDIVLIDASNPWGFDHLLPRGLLREPTTGLVRADLVVITRVDQVTREEIDNIRSRVTRIHPECAIVEAEFPATRLIDAGGRTQSIQTLAGMRVAAFCGVGNPAAFRASLERLSCIVVAFRSFADHYDYTPAAVDDLDNWSRELAVDAVVCTQKDLVKIGAEQSGGHHLWAVEIGTHLVAGEEAMNAKLTKLLT
jgi:tetraacyldisaccharide 4'-kinase